MFGGRAGIGRDLGSRVQAPDPRRVVKRVNPNAEHLTTAAPTTLKFAACVRKRLNNVGYVASCIGSSTGGHQTPYRWGRP